MAARSSTKATLITTEVKKDILSLSEFAPLHNRENLEGIEVSEKFFPEASQFAVFDTAFHSTLPEEIATYPGPYHWKKEGIRRYGFHGISFQYCSVQASQFLNRSLRELKMVICHLGNGASLCAIKEGKSFDTTMGFTPLEGLMMGTRSGTVDPSILFYLLRQGKDVDSIEKILNFQSGLLGISGISEDIREIEEAALRGEKRAKLSLEMFLYRLRGFIGMMIASLEGIDVLVFTGGIGEHSSLVRKETCKSLSYLGLEVDSKANDEKSKEDRAISGKASKVSILVIPTNEEKEIAQEGMRLFSD